MAKPTEHEIGAWYPRLFRTALRLTGGADEAAEVTQEAFCRALDKWDSYEGSALPTTWLHQILLNCVRDRNRHRRRESQAGETFDAWALQAIVGMQTTPVEQLEGEEERAHLRTTIEQLRTDLRSAFVATVIDGYTYKQAAELFAVPTGTIASRVYEARKQIHAEMRNLFPEE